MTGRAGMARFAGEWEEVRVGDVVQVRRDVVFNRSLDAGTRAQRCIELEHIGQGTGHLVSQGRLGAVESPKYKFRSGDVLFGRLRPYLRKYWLANEDGICTTEIWPLVSHRQAIVPGFLFAVVQTPGFIDAACSSYGTHMPRADWTVVKNVRIPLPPLPEQRAIAAVLSDIDAEIAALEERLKKTRAVKHSMMHQLLTGTIRLPIPEDDADHDHDT